MFDTEHTPHFLQKPFTVKNTVISPNFLVWKFYESLESMRKLCLSTKLPHQEIRRNYGIFCSV